MSDSIKRKSDATRERILKAALDLFHERGFDSTTMRDIAGRAEMAIGAAYYYFESKDAIVLAIYDQARTEMQPRLEEALDSSRDLRQRLYGIIKVKLDYFATSRKLLGALSGHTDPDHPLSPFSEQTREIREHDIAFFARALEGSRTPGHKDLQTHLPLLLWMYQMGIILFWIHDGSRAQAKTELLLDKSLDVVVRLIKLSTLPLTGPIRKSVTQLMDTLVAP
jgi:AcrR family transcriptional regulator